MMDSAPDLALACNREGLIREVSLFPQAGPLQPHTGDSLAGLFQPADRGRAEEFLRAVRVERVAGAPALTLAASYGGWTLHLAGCLVGRRIEIVGCTDEGRLLRHSASLLEEAVRQLQDLVEMGEAEQQSSADRIAQLERLSLRKDRFLSKAAHDIRNPLGVIATYSRLLLLENVGSANDAQKKLLSVIQASSRFLLRLVHELLDIQRIESGDLIPEPIQTDLAEIVREAVEISRATAETKGVRLHLKTPETVEAWADPALISQAVHQLLTNALQFSSSGDQIDVRLSVSGEVWQISVSDQGPGVGELEREQIFEPFVKGSNRPSDSEEGPGLGLTLCRAIVGAHQGRTWVEDNPSRGAVFHIALPRVRPPKNPPEPSETAGA